MKFLYLLAFLFLLFPAAPEMLRLIIFLTLAVVMKQSLGQNSGAASEISEKHKKEILERHNAIRRGVTPTARNMLKMQWSEDASKNAENWVRTCPTTVSPESERIVNGMECSQILRQASHVSSWTDVIDAWYSSSQNFKYGEGAIDKNSDIYSYTQLVWYNSYIVGCAIAICPHKTFMFFYICNYCHSGNIVSEAAKPYKAGPSCADCPDHCENKLCTNPCKYVDQETFCKSIPNYRLFSCKDPKIKKECVATCNCKTEIV